MRTRVKVCGMTRSEDVQYAVACGVDALGFILHADSPRLINIDMAARISRQVPALVNVVGVFVNASHDFILSCREKIGLDLVQLHGEESPTFAESLGVPYIKAVRAKSKEQVISTCEQYSSARAILLDPFVKGQHGGTGQLLSEDVWPDKDLEIPLILAGGLSANNIKGRLDRLRPFAVDINSGVELDPGIKDHHKLNACLAAVRDFDQSLNNHVVSTLT